MEDIKNSVNICGMVIRGTNQSQHSDSLAHLARLGFPTHQLGGNYTYPLGLL